MFPQLFIYSFYSVRWVANLEDIENIEMQNNFLEENALALYNNSTISLDLFEDIKNKCDVMRKEKIRDYKRVLLAAFLSLALGIGYSQDTSNSLVFLCQTAISKSFFNMGMTWYWNSLMYKIKRCFFSLCQSNDFHDDLRFGEARKVHEYFDHSTLKCIVEVLS